MDTRGRKVEGELLLLMSFVLIGLLANSTGKDTYKLPTNKAGMKIF